MTRGEIIKQRRRELGYSQRELAKKAGLSPATICLIENDLRCPSLKTAAKLCNVLGIDLNKLVLAGNANDARKAISQIDRIEEKLNIILERLDVDIEIKAKDDRT